MRLARISHATFKTLLTYRFVSVLQLTDAMFSFPFSFRGYTPVFSKLVISFISVATNEFLSSDFKFDYFRNLYLIRS